MKNYGNSNISPCKNIIFPKKKNPLIEETKILSRYNYYNSIITNLKFQHKPKYHISKNPHIKKKDLLLLLLLLLLPRGL